MLDCKISTVCLTCFLQSFNLDSSISSLLILGAWLTTPTSILVYLPFFQLQVARPLVCTSAVAWVAFVVGYMQPVLQFTIPVSWTVCVVLVNLLWQIHTCVECLVQAPGVCKSCRYNMHNIMWDVAKCQIANKHVGKFVDGYIYYGSLLYEMFWNRNRQNLPVTYADRLLYGHFVHKH